MYKTIVPCVLAFFVGCASTTKKASTESVESPKESTESSGASQGNESAESTSMVCKLGADIRTIAIGTSASGGCEVLYTREGTTNSIASAVSDQSYCRTVAERVRGNLTGSGFLCDEVSAETPKSEPSAE